MFEKLKTLRGTPQIDDDKLIFSIGRLRLAPGDIVVLTTPLLLDRDQVTALRERAEKFLPPENKVMILTGDMDVGVITRVKEGE